MKKMVSFSTSAYMAAAAIYYCLIDLVIYGAMPFNNPELI